MQPILKVSNLVKIYRRKDKIVKAVDDISFEADNGEIFEYWVQMDQVKLSQ